MKWHLSAANFVRGIFICLLGFWSKYFLEQGIFVDVMMIGKVSFFFFWFSCFCHCGLFIFLKRGILVNCRISRAKVVYNY